MTLTLDAYEAEVLLRALDGWLPELEFTLSRVRHPRDRHDLVVEDEVLRGIRERLVRMRESAGAAIARHAGGR